MPNAQHINDDNDYSSDGGVGNHYDNNNTVFIADWSEVSVQAAIQPPTIASPQPWQALQPGAPFPPPAARGVTPRDQVLCDLVYLFNNVLRCYAPAVGHAIQHQPSAVQPEPVRHAVAHGKPALPGSTQSLEITQVVGLCLHL